MYKSVLFFCFPVSRFPSANVSPQMKLLRQNTTNLLLPTLNSKLTEGSGTSFLKHLIKWDFE